MRILVTGAGGFLGRAIVRRLLARGDEVFGLGRRPQPELEKLGVLFTRGDVADAAAVHEACRGMDAVIHTAAKAGVWGRAEDYFAANVTGTRNVIAACRAQGVRLLVHTSTPSVVYNGRDIEGGNESLPYCAKAPNAYVATKALAEREALAADAPGVLSVCALRPHLIFGVGDPHLLPRVIAAAKAGRLRVVGEGKNRVDVTHVESAALAHVLAVDALAAGRGCGRAYFVSQGEPVLLWPWINALLSQIGVPEVTGHVSAPLAEFAGGAMERTWRLFSLRGEPSLTRFSAAELSRSHWFDISSARGDLGYAPAISTQEGVEAYAKDYLARIPSR
jgi:nucleoside-diphosphate-sugar epimerase